jgi:hypothetical protein
MIAGQLAEDQKTRLLSSGNTQAATAVLDSRRILNVNYYLNGKETLESESVLFFLPSKLRLYFSNVSAPFPSYNCIHEALPRMSPYPLGVMQGIYSVPSPSSSTHCNRRKQELPLQS